MILQQKHADHAARRLGCLRFYPQDEVSRAEIARVMMRMVDTVERLDWLVMTMVDRVGKWHGTDELRAVYCTRFKPADGIECWSSLSGFTAADSEAAAYTEHQKQKLIARTGEYPESVRELSEQKKLPEEKKKVN